MQKLVGEVPQGRSVEMLEKKQSHEHLTLARPEVWKPYLVQLMGDS